MSLIGLAEISHTRGPRVLCWGTGKKAGNKPQCVHTDFDPELVEKLTPSP